MIRVSGQSKSRPVKAAGAEVGAERRHQKLHAAVAKTTFGSENARKLTVSEHFWKFRCRKNARRCGEKHIWKSKCTKHEVLVWSSDVEKLYAAVAKSTFGSEHVQNMTCSEHFSKFRCRKIVRRCGEKHIWKWKCTKHEVLGALFEVQMSKNCTPLWRKAHLEVKMYKTWGARSTCWSSDVEKLYAAVAKSTFRSQNVKRLKFSEHFLRFWCREISQVVS